MTNLIYIPGLEEANNFQSQLETDWDDVVVEDEEGDKVPEEKQCFKFVHVEGICQKNILVQFCANNTDDCDQEKQQKEVKNTSICECINAGTKTIFMRYYF